MTEQSILETTQSPEINELVAALVKVQAQIKAASKDKTNPFFKSSYADLTSVWDVCREPLSENGLAVIQTMDGNNGNIIVITTLAHISGQWIKGKLPVKPVKEDPQAIGSAITYGRRYSLSAIVGVVSENDDDGEGAMGRGTGREETKPRKPPEKPKKAPPLEDSTKDKGEGKGASPQQEEDRKLRATLKKYHKANEALFYKTIGLHGAEKGEEVIEFAKEAQDSLLRDLEKSFTEMPF